MKRDTVTDRQPLADPLGDRKALDIISVTAIPSQGPNRTGRFHQGGYLAHDMEAALWFYIVFTRPF